MSVRSKLAAAGKLLRGDSEKRWVVAERLARIAHRDAVLGEHAKSWRTDPTFTDVVAKLPATPRSYDRLYALDQFARAAAQMPGDFAECGTYKGASAWFLCRRARDAQRQVDLFDSWEGLSAPSSVDGTYWSEHDLASTIEDARATLAEFDNAHFFPGWIPERFAEVSDRMFSLVHIDVDLYEPTRDALAFFGPRVPAGGFLICDDYGFESCPGARRAFDEYAAAHDELVVHLPTGQGLVLKRLR